MANTTWNASDKTAGVTLSGGNLVLTCATSASQFVRSVDKQITGKFYWECTFTTVAGTLACGVANASATLSSVAPTTAASANVALVNNSGQVFVNGVQASPTIGSITSGAVVCIAMDFDAQRIWFRNGAAGNWNGSAANNPATGVGGVATPIAGVVVTAYAIGGGVNANTTGSITANFGGSAFSGAVPSGFTSGFTAGASPALFAAATQAALEHWASVATVTAPAGGPMITMVM